MALGGDAKLRDVQWGGDGIVRAARRSDAEAIAQVHAHTWRRAYAGLLPMRTLARLDERTLAKRWARADLRRGTLVAVDGSRERAVGFVQAGVSGARGFGGRAAEVFMLYVLPAYAGRGHGTRLLEAALRRSAADGAYWLHIWVLAENKAARFFYGSRGLRWDGTRRRDTFDGRTVEVVRYAKALNSVWDTAVGQRDAAG